MHQPGYIQEGQGVSFGYLLLGVYHRRIPGATVREKKKDFNGRMERFEVLKALNMFSNLSQMSTDANTKSERYIGITIH